MRKLRRRSLAVLFVAALHYPGAIYAKKPADKDWVEFISESTAYLSKQQDTVRREFKLESWKRYSFDSDTGTFTFSTNGKPGVVAHALVVGSIAGKPRTWLWSWADSSAPESLSKPILQVRKFGKDHGFSKLTEPSWPGGKTDGWEMAAAAARILSAKGAYRAPYEGGFIFLIFTDIHRVR